MTFSRSLWLIAMLAVQWTARAAPGDLDATFGTGGRARITMPGNSSVLAATVQPDGKVVAVGNGNVVFAPVGSVMAMRLGLDGSPDTTFSNDGFAGTNWLGITQLYGVAVHVMPDNKILVAAQVYAGQNLNWRILAALVRFNADGSPDTSFGAEGIRLLDFDPANPYYVSAMVVQPDGRIVLGGNNFNGQGNGDYVFVRANADGSLDSSFGTAGVSRIDFAQTGDELIALARMPDGKLLGVGHSIASGVRARIGIVRLLANGQLDTASDGGKLRVSISSLDRVHSVAQQADGKLLIAGTADSHGFDPDIGFVARLDTQGAVDTSFGSQGRIVRADQIFAVAAHGDGRVVFAGKDQPAGLPEDWGRGFVQAVRADGSADPDFAPAGRTRIDFGSGSDWSRFATFALLGMSDGRFVVLGNADQPTLLATRLRASGGHPGVLSLSRNDAQGFGGPFPESHPPIEFIVERTGGSSGSVSVNYAASGPVAAAGRDFTETSGTLTWGDGETAAKKILLPLIDDNDFESANEVIDMTLSAPTGGALLGASQVSLQTSSDEYGVRLIIEGGTVLESEGTAVVRVARLGDTRQATTVDYTISDGTAVAGVNYTATPSGTLSWNSGDMSDRFITFALIDNPGTLGGGSVNVTLSNSNGRPDNQPDPSATVNIMEDDGPQGTPSAGRFFYYVGESAGSVNVSLGRPNHVSSGSPETLNLSTSSGDPAVIAGSDFGAPGTTQLTWAAGDYSRRTISIPILADNRFEQTECFTLYDGLGGMLAVICILDDDPYPGIPGASFAQAEYRVSENVGVARLQVDRVGDSSRELRVAVGWGGSIAHSLAGPGDFPLPAGTVLLWGPDDTAPKFVDFPVVNDSVPEPEEERPLTLSGFYPYENVPLSGARHTARIVVENDDGPFTSRVGFTQSSVTISEDEEYVDLTIAPTGTGADSSVTFQVRAGSTADLGTEFVPIPERGGFYFQEPSVYGQTLRIWLNGDRISEGDESFTVDLTGQPGYTPVGQSSVTVTLLSNDVNIPALPMQVGFAATSITQAENNTAVNLTVNRAGPITSALSVHYETLAGTALAGTDYTAATGDVTWAAGDGADKTITINLINDGDVEGAETLSVRLSAPTNGATLSADTATITINSEDVAPPPSGGGGSSSGGGGGGGGGRLDAALLLFAMLCVAGAQRRRRSRGINA